MSQQHDQLESPAAMRKRLGVKPVQKQAEQKCSALRRYSGPHGHSESWEAGQWCRLMEEAFVAGYAAARRDARKMGGRVP